MNTGYSTISRNICNALSDEFEVHYEAHNYLGQSIPPGLRLQDGFTFKFTLWGAGREQYCKDVTPGRIQSLKAEVHIILLDTFMVYPWFLDMNYAPAKTIFYFPSDGGGGLPLGCDQVLRHCDLSVAMSRFAQQQAKELYNIDAEYIPHAIDSGHYRPLSDREKEQARREFTVLLYNGQAIKGFLLGKFVVGVVARNQPRKMLDRTIKSFALFCRDKPDAVMFFHSDMLDPAAGIDLRELIVRYHLENRVVFSPMKAFENFEYKEMNKVYNVMDIFFLTTSGEGFGVPTIEAMSCELPIVITDYTTTKELIVDDGLCGIPVPLEGEVTGGWNVERGLMDIKAGATALTELYLNPMLRHHYGMVGREKVLKYYTWDAVIPLWKNLLRRLSS